MKTFVWISSKNLDSNVFPDFLFHYIFLFMKQYKVNVNRRIDYHQSNDFQSNIVLIDPIYIYIYIFNLTDGSKIHINDRNKLQYRSVILVSTIDPSIHRFFTVCAQLSLPLSNTVSPWQGNNKRTWDKRGRAGENSNTPGQAKCRLSLTLSQKGKICH